MAQLLDKRVNTELGRIKKDITARLDTFRDTLREEIADDIEVIDKKVQAISQSTTRQVNPGSVQDLSLNVVIRNLPETVNEDITEKVNALISKSLKFGDVKIAKAVRKTSNSSSRSGIVIVTFKSANDKSKVMSVKAKLKGDNILSNVFINNDQSFDDRRLSNSLKTIVDAVNRGDTNLSVQGTRVVRKQPSGSRSGYTHASDRRHNTNRPDLSNGHIVHRASNNASSDFDRRNSGNSGRDSTNNHDGWTSVRRGGNRGRGRGGQRAAGYRGRN